MQPLRQSKASNYRWFFICNYRLRINVVCRQNLERILYSLPSN
jgi:hypothetical protein